MTLAHDDRGAGPVLLLVHGFPLSRRMWRRQLEGLDDACRVIAVDLPGFGESPPLTSAEPLTMAALADDLAAFLQQIEIDEPVWLAGLSMGGYVALEFWQRHAELLQGLILCDTRAEADDEATRRVRETGALAALNEGVEGVAETMLPRLLSADSQRQEDLVTEVRSMMTSADPVGVAAAQRGMAGRRDMTGRLPDIELPCLVLCGAEDTITPPAGMREMAAALPRSRYVELPGAGHLAPLEQPAAANDAIRAWLAGQAAR